MQGRTTPFVLGAAVLVILAIIGGYFLFKGEPESEEMVTERLPTEPQPVLTEEKVPDDGRAFATPELEKVYFDFDRYSLRADARSAIQQNLSWLKRNPNVIVKLEGHCDERGTEEYNLVLGERRAAAVSKMLVRRGVQSDRVETMSYGKGRPEVMNADTEDEHQLNRRVVFLADRMN